MFRANFKCYRSELIAFINIQLYARVYSAKIITNVLTEASRITYANTFFCWIML